MKENKFYEGERFRLDLIANIDTTIIDNQAVIDLYLSNVSFSEFQKDIKLLMEKCLTNKTYVQ